MLFTSLLRNSRFCWARESVSKGSINLDGGAALSNLASLPLERIREHWPKTLKELEMVEPAIGHS